MRRIAAGTKIAPGVYTYADGRFTLRRDPFLGVWDAWDTETGMTQKGFPSKKGAVSWIVRRVNGLSS